MSRWRREVSGLIYASEGFTPRPPSHPLATKRVMLSYSMHKGPCGCPLWPFSHSTIVAIVSIVGPYLGGGEFTDMVVCLFVCSSDGLDWAGTWLPRQWRINDSESGKVDRCRPRREVKESRGWKA